MSTEQNSKKKTKKERKVAEQISSGMRLTHPELLRLARSKGFIVEVGKPHYKIINPKTKEWITTPYRGAGFGAAPVKHSEEILEFIGLKERKPSRLLRRARRS